ncbi:hypothetical protein [Bacillus cereus]|uniref:hypothetical protein n=1 Tax=Bacillus cereus TaxID=1396 RepID=UPI000BF8827B|nr:hypothetical protein [Bacillus cereus]PEX80710.1 hypothetical protein CN450_24940 [Bacillus cereus]
MKKAILGISLASALLLPTGAFAESQQVVKSQVYDKEKVPNKEFTPQPLNPSFNTLAAVPYWSANSGQYALGGTWSTSDSYTSSSKASKKAINKIWAKTKHYVDGGFRGSKTDTQYNASHAGAEVNKGSWIVGDDEVYGEHGFEHSGYQSWYPETYKS